jgi:3'-phosphoadenosine 5'-phosphosulfate sulfotransferase (PAPS reductase)/FAD synthetase
MKQQIIIGNFGNHSLAVMQALIERGVQGLHFVYVNTGWAAAGWFDRVFAYSEYARQHGVKVQELKVQATFSEMVIDRQQFPSPKFQWCASFLKGLTIINHLDNCDPSCEALIISGKRRQDSRRYATLQEFDYEDEFYQGRTLWYPLFQLSDSEFVQLVKRTGFPFEPQPSLECSPCIHTKPEELSQVDPQSLARLEALEHEIGQTMYQGPIKGLCSTMEPARLLEREKKPGLQQFDRGCGAPWGCGE